MKPLKLLLVAGEVSGDQHAAALLDALRSRVELAVLGLGGDLCAARGMRLLAHQKDLAVVGLVEALSKVRLARRLIHRLVDEAVAQRVDGAVLIDSPDFNLPLARRLARAGIRVVFYVSPQVWAWRSGRARTLTSIGEAVLVLFAFEKRWYEERGLGSRVTWVGHPLVDEAEKELRETAPPPPDGTRRLVLMPGSRSGEIRRHLPVMRQAVELLARAHRLEVVLIRAASVSEPLLDELAGPLLSQWRVVTGPHLALLASADVLLVASGTATVEGLLARVPMVVVYKVNALTFFLGKQLIKVPHVAMANLVSGADGVRTVPELLQREATPERVAAAAAAFLEDPVLALRTRERLGRGAADLGQPGAAERTADAVLKALAPKSSLS